MSKTNKITKKQYSLIKIGYTRNEIKSYFPQVSLQAFSITLNLVVGSKVKSHPKNNTSNKSHAFEAKDPVSLIHLLHNYYLQFSFDDTDDG